MSTIRVGTASPCTQPTTPATITLLSQIAARASRQKIDILVLPEAFIGGYPRGSTFGCAIGSRSAQGRDEFVRYFEQAVDLGDTVGDGAGAGSKWEKREIGAGEEDRERDGEDARRGMWKRGDGTREELERIARDTGVFIVTGLIEKTGGSLYCAVVYICPELGMIGKRRKVQPTGSERLIWAQGSPATLRAITTTIRGQRINLAAAICWENYMPLVRQALYAQNVNLYIAPTADGRDTWMSLMRTVGIEGRCFVVSSNMCVRDPHTAAAAAAARLSHEDEDGDDLPWRVRRQSTIADIREEKDENEHELDAEKEDKEEKAAAAAAAAVDEEEAASEVSPSKPPPSPPQRRKRRKSVFDEDGNEIVLSCDADTEIHQDEFSPMNGSQHAVRIRTAPAAHPRPASSSSSPPAPHLQSSVTSSSSAAAAAAASFLSRGGSSIVSPFGDVLAGPQWEDDHNLIYADIDLKQCIGGRLDLDTAGSYSRNDSFKFSVEGLNLDPLPY